MSEISCNHINIKILDKKKEHGQSSFFLLPSPSPYAIHSMNQVDETEFCPLEIRVSVLVEINLLLVFCPK